MHVERPLSVLNVGAELLLRWTRPKFVRYGRQKFSLNGDSRTQSITSGPPGGKTLQNPERGAQAAEPAEARSTPVSVGVDGPGERVYRNSRRNRCLKFAFRSS